jgi:hypothetical protein
MNYQRRSTETGRTIYHYTSSNHSPLTIGNNFQDAIPPGTVASRIQFLQGLANPIPSRSHPPPIRIRRGQDSRTGFGRRLTNRFGKPALQNTKPDEEPQIATSLHSFLGLNTPRKNHGEQHAIADHRTKYTRSPGINGQVIPDGMTVRTQHDAVAPWGVLSRNNHSRSMGRHVTDSEVEFLKEINNSKSNGRFTTESSKLRIGFEDDAKYINLYRQNVKLRPAGTMNSEASNATASTTRRQSVRDLFKDYGIERPAGLASRETSYDMEDNPKPVRPHRHCHVCSWLNIGISTVCFRCSHRLCSECNTLSPVPRSREWRGLVNKDGANLVKELASKENWSIDQGAANQRFIKRVPISVQPRKEVPLSKPPTNLPDLHYVDTSIWHKKPSQAAKYDRAFPEGSLAAIISSGLQVPTRVRDSPFLIADLLASKRSLPSFPVRAPISNSLGHRCAQNRLKQLGHRHNSSSSSEGYNCDSPTCRATHNGHQPYRHAVSCIKKKRHRHVHKDKDNDHSVDGSRIEAPVRVHSSSFSHITEQHSRPRSAVPDYRILRSRVVTRTLFKQEVPESVECHGYPRTGHSRLGSPVSSGIVGECQHCLHDCPCAACQSSFHSVRCCIHTDHQAMVHHHLTPRKETSASEKEVATLPLHEPTTSDKSLASNKFPAIAPSSDQKSLSVTAKPPKNSTYQDQLVKKPLSKEASLPRSKASTLKAGVVAKPPTPPRWVSSPRRESKSGIVNAERWKETRQDNTDTLIGIEPVANPPPSFKEKPTFPPSALCDESNPEGSHRASNDMWSTLRSRQEPGLNNERRESYRRPSNSSIVEKYSKAPSIRSLSRMQMSPPGSRRASRRLSALFQLKEKNTVPLLNQKLLQHQEELRRTQKECDNKLEIIAQSELEDLIWSTEREEAIHDVRPEKTERVEGPGITKADALGKSKWRLKLVDRKPSPACANDKFVEEHRLFDDKVESGRQNSKLDLAEKRAELPGSKDHDCVWKSRLLGQVLGIQGVTVLLHLQEKEDVIFKAVDWKVESREQ